MRITTDLFIVLCYLILLRLVSAKIVPRKTNRTSLRTAAFPNMIQFDRSAYPEPLPTDPPKKLEVSPYTTIYQGVRHQDDTRVFRKRFDHEARLTGQQITCQGLFDCVISHIAIESTEAIPVLLRGGAGYRHFTAVIKAKPNHDLKGQVRVYCRNKDAPLPGEEGKKKGPQRRFDFGDRLNEENFT